MKSENILHKSILSVMYFFAPIVFSLIGAFLYLPSWYYSFFKVIMIVDAIIAICIFHEYKSKNKDDIIMVLLGTTVILSFISVLGIVSQFFIPGGFPKTLWIILDITYAIAKVIQYKALSRIEAT